MMKALIEQFISKGNENELLRQEIEKERAKVQKQIEKGNAKIAKLEEKRGDTYLSWVSEITEPLASALAERLDKKFDIYGPFGMRHQTTIYLFEDETKSITEQKTLRITLIPNLEHGEILYKTGETVNGLPYDHIKDPNGFSLVTGPLPFDFEEIVAIVLKSERD